VTTNLNYNVTQLIPLSSLLSGFNVLVAIFCASLLWFRRRDLLKSDPLVKRFFNIFVYCAAQFSWSFLPGTLVKDTYFIQVVYTFADMTIMWITIYLFSIPLNMFPQTQKLKQFVKTASWVMLVFSISYVGYNLQTIKPAIPVTYGTLIDWRGTVEPTLQLIAIAFAAICLIATVSFFFFRGWQHENNLIRKRSRILTAGFFSILLGWVVISLFSAFASQGMGILLTGGAIGTGFMSLGFVALLSAIFTKAETR